MINKIICKSLESLSDVVNTESVDLSIVYPPQNKVENQHKIKIILEKVNFSFKSTNFSR